MRARCLAVQNLQPSPEDQALKIHAHTLQAQRSLRLYNYADIAMCCSLCTLINVGILMKIRMDQYTA